MLEETPLIVTVDRLVRSHVASEPWREFLPSLVISLLGACVQCAPASNCLACSAVIFELLCQIMKLS